MGVWTTNWVKIIIQCGKKKGRENNTSLTYKRWDQFLIVLPSLENQECWF